MSLSLASDRTVLTAYLRHGSLVKSRTIERSIQSTVKRRSPLGGGNPRLGNGRGKVKGTTGLRTTSAVGLSHTSRQTLAWCQEIRENCIDWVDLGGEGGEGAAVGAADSMERKMAAVFAERWLYLSNLFQSHIRRFLRLISESSAWVDESVCRVVSAAAFELGNSIFTLTASLCGLRYQMVFNED